VVTNGAIVMLMDKISAMSENELEQRCKKINRLTLVCILGDLASIWQIRLVSTLISLLASELNG
jgi:hypothetical protein